MVRIEFDLDSIYEETALAIIAMLEKKFPEAKASHVPVKMETTAVPVNDHDAHPLETLTGPMVGTAEATAEPQPERPKRGRPRKETPAEPENPTLAPSGAAVDAAPSPEPPSQPAAAGEAKVFTVDELRAGLQKFTVKHGMVKGKELLDSFGCARVTEVADKGSEVHAKFMAKCDA